jgi:hypothetical protein
VLTAIASLSTPSHHHNHRLLPSLIPLRALISRKLCSFSNISCLSPTSSSSLLRLPITLPIPIPLPTLPLCVVKAVSSLEWRFDSGLSGLGSDLMTRHGFPAAMV